MKSQPISGVSAGVEAEVMTVYPSVAATIMGRRIGRLCESLPLRTHGVPWGRLLITLPLWPIIVPLAITVSLGMYAVLKLFGSKYVLTNRHLQVRSMIGVRTTAQAALTDIADVIIEEIDGQAYYKAADLVARGKDGKTLVRLEGVVRPAVFRQTILEMRTALLQVDQSLKAIQARKI